MKKTNYILNQLQQHRLLVALYILLLASGVLFSAFHIFLILVFPFAFLLKQLRSRIDLLVYVPIILMLNLMFNIVALVAMTIANLEITASNVLLVYTIAGFIMIFIPKNMQLSRLTLPRNHLRTILYIYALFLLAVAVRVLSVSDVLAPILHDPIAHAYYSETIVREGAIEYFYSPGLHEISATIRLLSGISAASAIHFVTQFANAFTVLSWSIVMYLISKKPSMGLTTSVLLFLSSFPVVAYTAAGKNALVLAIALVPLFIYFTVELISQFNKRGLLIYVLYTFAGFALALTHYPSFAVFFIGSLTSVFLYITWQFISKNNRSYRVLLRSLMPAIAVLLLLGGWVVYQRTRYDTFVSNSLTGNKSVIPEGQNIIIYYFENTIEKIRARWGTTPGRELTNSINAFAFPLLVTSLLYQFFAYRPRTQKLKAYQLTAMTTIVVAFVLIFSLPIIELPRTQIVRSTAQIIIPVLTVMVSVPVLWNIGKSIKISQLSKKILSILLVSILVAVSIQQVRHYRATTAGSEVINQYDIAAFSWINNNLPTKVGFVNNAIKSDVRSHIVFGSDGGAWLPVYTNSYVSMPFELGKFNDVQTHENFEAYDNLRNAEDVHMAVADLTSRGYNYYYHDKVGWLTTPLDMEKLQKYATFVLIYENDGVAIYSISL